MEKDKDKNQSKMIKNIDGIPAGSESDFGVENNQDELVFRAFHRKIDFRKKFLKIIGITFVLLMIIIASISVYLRNKNSKQNVEPKQQLQIEVPQNQDYIFVNDVSGVSAQESNVEIAGNDDARGIAGKSENYRIRDISIGGASVVLAAGTENLPLIVSDVRSETLMSKDGKKIQLLISWKTNKLAKSEVGYSKDGKGVEKKVKDEGYGFSHALVINSLEQATRYLFTVKVSDRGGNVANSDTLAVYTGSRPVSVFDLISSQMDDIFGWALKK